MSPERARCTFARGPSGTHWRFLNSPAYGYSSSVPASLPGRALIQVKAADLNGC
jgi:hypothetical protein